MDEKACLGRQPTSGPWSHPVEGLVLLFSKKSLLPSQPRSPLGVNLSIHPALSTKLLDPFGRVVDDSPQRVAAYSGGAPSGRKQHASVFSFRDDSGILPLDLQSARTGATGIEGD